ncbi:hypothetical protein HDU97_000940 [Phlyctochytrium planicorne]|nr:hypothetical protein HDU97_000940 [Phlyctochytrium planicorne]
MHFPLTSLLLLSTTSLIQATTPFQGIHLESRAQSTISNITLMGIPCPTSDGLIQCLKNLDTVTKSIPSTCTAPVTVQTIPDCACPVVVAEAKCATDYCPNAYKAVVALNPNCLNPASKPNSATGSNVVMTALGMSVAAAVASML